jgi:hypothetical protein
VEAEMSERLKLTEATAIHAVLIVVLIKKGLLRRGELLQETNSALAIQRAKHSVENADWIASLEQAQAFLQIFDAPRDEPPDQSSMPEPESTWH